jgi:DNA adenine methylase
MSNKIAFFPYVGGKFYMLDKILPLIPEHKIYIEVFGGSAKVLLNKKPSKIEVYNDFNKHLSNLFYVVAFHYEDFYNKAKWLLNSQNIFDTIKRNLKEKIEIPDVEQAVFIWFLFRTSYSGTAKAFSLHFGKNNILDYEDLEKTHQRLRNVIITNKDFEFFKTYDTENTFYYFDPPYWDRKCYKNNFTLDDHKRLLKMLKELKKSKWMLSCYDNDLYKEELKDVFKVKLHIKNYLFSEVINKNSKKINKGYGIETLYLNYIPDYDINKIKDLLTIEYGLSVIGSK